MLKFPTLALTLAISYLICCPSQPAKAAGFMDLFSKKPVYVNGTWKAQTGTCDGQNSKGSYVEENSGKMRNAYCNITETESPIRLENGTYKQDIKTTKDLYDTSTGTKIATLQSYEYTNEFPPKLPESLETDLAKYKAELAELKKEYEATLTAHKSDQAWIEAYQKRIKDAEINLSTAEMHLEIYNLSYEQIKFDYNKALKH